MFQSQLLVVPFIAYGKNITFAYMDAPLFVKPTYLLRKSDLSQVTDFMFFSGSTVSSVDSQSRIRKRPQNGYICYTRLIMLVFATRGNEKSSAKEGI